MSAAKKTKESVEDVFAKVRSTAFFNLFSEDVLDQLGPMGEVEFFKSGSDILSEGEKNDRLFVLVDGRVDVLIGRERIARLGKRGEVFGEMTLISQTDCSATIRTIEDSVFFTLDHNAITMIEKQYGGRFGCALYKTFSKILSERLASTNEKARWVEKANEELKVAKWLTINTIEELYRKDLRELSETLAAAVEKPKKIDVNQLKRRVDGVIELIHPIAERSISEKLLRTKKVLLAEPNKKQQRTARMALRGTGVSLDIVSDKAELFNAISQEKFDILLLSDALVDVAPDAHKAHPEMNIVLITSDNVSGYLSTFTDHPFLTNVISRNEEDRTFTVKNIFTTIGKLANQDIFGLEKYLAWGTEIKTEKVLCSDQRSELNDGMVEHFTELGIRQTVTERCRLVCEEMLMNAIYDAPVDNEGKSLYNHKSRTEIIELQPHEQSTFRYACDGIMAAVSVQDPFGALQRETLLKYLESCYSGQAGVYNKNKGGGGMGMHLIVESSDFVIFNVKEGVKTEVIALFNVDRKVAEKLKSPSFHFFFV